MKNKTSKKTRSRAEILAEIVALPPSVQGTISSYKNVRKNGTSAVYYNLQYTHKGKNHSFAIPTDKVADFKATATGQNALGREKSKTYWTTSGTLFKALFEGFEECVFIPFIGH